MTDGVIVRAIKEYEAETGLKVETIETSSMTFSMFKDEIESIEGASVFVNNDCPPDCIYFGRKLVAWTA